MRLIIAYIQPEKLNDVKKSLFDEEVYRISVTNSLGCGQQKGFHEVYRGVEEEVNLLRKVRIEIAVNDDFEERTIKAIIRGAKTGNIGDGKIFVVPLDKCIRIRTEESGKEAIG